MKSFILGVNFQTRRNNRRPTLFDRHPGQAIVLVAVLMIVLLGFTGLALDGGELYFLQRDAQNGVDAAVLAALYQWCGYPSAPPATRDFNMRTEAARAATQNGFTDGVNGATVTITRPSVPPGGGAADDNLITVVISATKPSRLIQVVYNGPLQVTVTAVGRCTPASTFTQAAAMMGIGVCPNNSHPGIDISGSSVSVTGNPGALFTNGIITQSGSSYTVNGTSNENVGVTVPEFWHMNDFAPGGHVAIWAADQTPNAYHSHIGNVTSWDDWGISSNNPTPGVYYASGSVTLGPADFDSDTDMTEVTIASPGQIDISLPGSSDVSFSAFPVDDPAADVPYYGIPPVMPTFFSTFDTRPDCNTNPNAINVSGAFDWTNVIYAPFGPISMTDNRAGTANGSLVGYVVSWSGSGLTITYNPDDFPPIPPQVGIIQ